MSRTITDKLGFRVVTAALLSALMFIGLTSVGQAAVTRILSPASGSAVRGIIEIAVGFESDSKAPVTHVLMKVDGKDYGRKFLSSPELRGVVSLQMDSSSLSAGSRGISVFLFSGKKQIGKSYISVLVGDVSGNPSTPVKDQVVNQNSGSLILKGIDSNKKVSGSQSIQVATDAIAGAQFVAVYVNGKLRYLSNRKPFNIPLDTTVLADGQNRVDVQVRDAGQNILASRSVALEVDNSNNYYAQTPAPSRIESASVAPSTGVKQVKAQAPAVVAPSAKTYQQAARSSDQRTVSQMVKPAPPVVKNVPVQPVIKTDKQPENPLQNSKPAVGKTEERTATTAEPDAFQPSSSAAGLSAKQGVAFAAVPEFYPEAVVGITAVKPAEPAPEFSPESGGIKDERVVHSSGLNWEALTAKADIAFSPATPQISEFVNISRVASAVRDVVKTSSRVEELGTLLPSSGPAELKPAAPGLLASAVSPVAADGSRIVRPSAPTLVIAKAVVPEPMKTPSKPISSVVDFTEPATVLIEGRAFVRLRLAIEQLGGKVTWDAKRKTAKAHLKGKRIILKPAEKPDRTLKSRMIDGVTYVPAALLQMRLGVKTIWQDSDRAVTLLHS